MKIPRKIRAWLELVRAPNLLTVPGDPLAGYLLSGGVAIHGMTRAVPVVLSSLCLYCFGLIMNDIADVEVDRKERPSRPIPSGRVSLSAGKIVSIFFLIWGLAMAWLTGRDAGIVASALAIAVIVYNVLLKKRPIAGPVSMGACRGLSVMLGAVAGGGINHRVALAVAGLTLYVAAFTSIAQLEMKTVRIGMRKWLPSVVLALTFGVLFYLALKDSVDSIWLVKSAVPALLSIGLALMCARKLMRVSDISGVIGGFIANMMLVQAGLCTMAGGMGQIVGALIACMVPGFLLLALKFYSS